MRSHLGASLFVVFFVWSFSNSFNNWAQGHFLDDQRALLIQLNRSLISRTFPIRRTSNRTFPIGRASKRISWRLNTDCCSSWDGIACDRGGHVISLDLSSEAMHGELNSLFKLKYLVSLNLADNRFYDTPVPSGFDQLTNLEYLNLAYSGFAGQIPIGISRMTRLVTLDLSSTNRLMFSKPSELVDPDLETLTRNLTELRQLVLDGTFDSSLSKLRSLSVLHLDLSSISGEVPTFLSKFHNLTSLHLHGCNLYGKFPERVLQLQALQSLDLSGNDRLQGSLPEFPKGGLLRELVLSDTSFKGELPNSIGNLRYLSRLDLHNDPFFKSMDSFSGSIPTSFSKLNQLEYLDLSRNCFTGPITSINSSETLTFIDLSHNRLAGPIPYEWNELPELNSLNLANNLLNGTISMGLLSLPSLQNLDLSMNQFTGQLGEFSNASSSQLYYLDLSNNQLQGHIPVSMFGMSSLLTLILSSNNFSGTTNSNSVTNITSLSLSGNQFTEIPIFLKYQSHLFILDLSNNKIHGKIPNWIWKIGNGGLGYLNISQNFLEDPDQPWPVNSFESMVVLDLHSNRLQGNNPILPSFPDILDYSFNNFTAMIPNISSHLSDNEFLSFSNNQISGDISTWVCGSNNFEFLDLSYNNFSGPIPSCLGSSLRVLNLRGNNFQGRLPKSIASSTYLEVLDVGNNQLTDTFPSWLPSMPQLRVLVLRSNNFYGAWGGSHGAQCNSSMLQIIDISSNKFSGFLPKDCFSSWTAMMINKEEREWNRKGQILQNYDVQIGLYYQPKVTVTSKGIDTELVKILTTFMSIDLSNNRFEGEIPEIIGSLTSLGTLNLSHNAFTGRIPSTFGNLTHLESLDLSRNNLTGKIPFQLAGLSYLSVLNISFNKLVGEIPTGGQFQTFESSSFQGNIGLCGFPLSKGCNTTVESPPNGSKSRDENALGSKDEFDWVLFAVTFLGFVLGAGMVIGP